MRDLGVGAYRFSIAWPRVFPEGRGRMNPKGFAYYDRLVDELLGAGIEPAATLYHWDLPLPLHEAGGWPARDTALAFGDYAAACYAALGDRVRTWITLNEPWCSSYLSYAIGEHAPGHRDPVEALRAVHHLNLAHGLGLEAFRASGREGKIGITLNLSTPRPATARPEDLEAAELATDRDSRVFTGPLTGRGYPERWLRRRGATGAMPVRTGDLERIAKPIDFLGLNYYTEPAIAADPSDPDGGRVAPQGNPETHMGWPVVSGGLARQLRWVAREFPGLPLYITENGAAYDDRVEGGRVRDAERIGYLRSHLEACSRAIADGVPLKGYYLWSFIDNFEWAWGYSRRFGIVHCDFRTLARTPKDSYYWYRDVIAGYGE
jgi:beta-glucosidase